MPRWSWVFFLVAVIAAVFGFTGISSGTSEIARFCFFFFVVVFKVSLWGSVTGRQISMPS